MKVINLIGAPSSGKTTNAAGVFKQIKLLHKNAFLVSEYAKELTYLGTLDDTNQETILKEQNRRQDMLRGKVDYAITDSPLILGLYYSEERKEDSQEFKKKCLDTFNSYENINFFLVPHENQVFEISGRIHDEEQSKLIKYRLEEILISQKIDYYRLVTHPDVDLEIVSILKSMGVL